ncbi:MAG: T9SS type A sorting domain-containing protein, partial [Bacteroidales bacterium]|nr:T9SS type A sorting domain-containing protein [Bacteroidales bacterium]
GKDKFMVNVEIDNVLFYLYDMQGKLIFKRKLKSDNTIINCSRLLPGIYIYTITKEDRVIKGGKWVKL